MICDKSIPRKKKVKIYKNIISSVLARHALWRYDNAFLQNENAIFSFQITLFSMSNNCLFGVVFNWVLQCHNCSQNSVIRSSLAGTKYRYRRRINFAFVSKPDGTARRWPSPKSLLFIPVFDSLLQISVASSL